MRSRPFIILLILLLYLTCAHAIRISPDSVLIAYEPGLEREYVFATDKMPNTVVGIEGDLAPYLTVTQNTIEDDGMFVVKISLPEMMETPGDNVAFVSVMEGGKDAGMIGGIAAIRTPIVVRVPYPGSYSNLDFNVPNVNGNETGYFIVTVDNRGDHAESAKASVQLFSGTTVVDTFTSDTIPVPTNSRERIVIPFDPSHYSPGPYRALAEVSYGDKKQKLEDRFTIGALQVDITGYSAVFLPHKINKVDIAAESRWNTILKDVFAEVTILNGSIILNSFKTPTVEFPPLGKVLLQGYWDATSIGEGNYTMVIVLSYEGKQNSATSLISVAEERKEVSLFADVNWMIVGLAAAVVLLIILNLAILFRRKP